MASIAEIRRLLGYDVLLLPWPKGSKGTKRRWKHLTAAHMNDCAYLSKLNRATNIGVALGRVSGGLCSIDIDADDWVEPFLQQNPALRDTPRTKGARGCNFWVRLAGNFPVAFKIKAGKTDIGEFRADGSQTIISGTHPDGVKYRFLNHAKPVEVAFDGLWFPTGTEGNIQRAWAKVDGVGRTERSERSDENKRDAGPPRRRAGVSLKKILLEAKPDRKHTNHHCLFVLARGVLALEEQHGKCYSRAELRDVVNQWYAAAQPYVRENLASEDYFIELLEWLDYTHTPLGSSTVDVAFQLAQESPPPPESAQFESPEYKLLTALCWQLQRLAGDEPFFLSCRSVQRLFGLETHTQGMRRLGGLVRFGVLEVVKQGGPKTNKATRYRFVESQIPRK